jgi:uncharacterized protein involved in outer membrane biogenesis
VRVRRLLQAAGLVVVLALGLVLAVLAQGGEWLRRVAQARLQAEVLPQVEIGHAVEWSLRPQPGVVLRALSLKDERGGALLEIDEIALSLQWDDLRKRRLRLHSLRLAGTRLVLRRDADGHWNAAAWLRPRAEAPAGATAGGLPELGQLVLDDLRVDVVDARAGLALQLALPALQGGPFGADAEGRLAVRMALALQAPREGALNAELQTAYALDALQGTLTLQDLRTTLEAALHEEAGAAGWQLRDGRLSIERLALSRAGALALAGAVLEMGVEGPALQATLNAALGELEGRADQWRALGELDLVSRGFPAAHLHGTLQLTPQQLEGTLAGQLQDAALSGRWRWAQDAVPPLDLVLDLAHFDADAWQAAMPPSGGGGGLPDWAAWPLNADIRIGRLRMAGVEASDARLRLGEAPAAR